MRSTPTGCWWPALTLTERRDIRRAGSGGDGGPLRAGEAGDLLARHQAWSSKAVLASVEDLAARLALDCVTLEEYRELSGPGMLPAGEDPPWLRFLEQVLARWPQYDDSRSPQADPAREAVVTLVWPFVVAVLREVRAGLGGLGDHDPAGVLAGGTMDFLLLRGLTANLANTAARTVVHELNTAQAAAGGGRGLEEVAASFRRSLAGEQGPALLRAYPVLARSLAERCLQHGRNALELARRLRDDAHLLATFAPGRDLGAVVDVSEPCSDRHRGGWTVQAITFASGARVLHKPRSLAVDAVVASFLRLLNARGIEATQRPVRVLDRGEYGWSEVVETAPCASRAEVERYARRQGGLLAVAHVLAAVDLHFGNIIAEGPFPVAVDLESFLQPRVLPGPGGPQALLDTGMLPRPGANPEHDTSGVAGGGGLLDVPVAQLSVRDGRARFEDAPVQLGQGRNRPVLDGSAVDLRDLVAHVEAGFREVCGAIRAAAETLEAPGGLLERCEGVRVRVLLRNTDLYGRLLHSCSHPELLRDALDRERLLDVLWRDSRAWPPLGAVFGLERAALHAGDVPVFSVLAGEGELCDPYGDGTGMTVAACGLDVVRERLRGLHPGEEVDRLAALLRRCLVPATGPDQG